MWAEKLKRWWSTFNLRSLSLWTSFVPRFGTFSDVGWTKEIIIELEIKGLSLLCSKGEGLKRLRRWWKDPVFTAPPSSAESTVSPILMYLLSGLPLAFHSADLASIYIALRPTLRNPLERVDRPRPTGPLVSFALSHQDDLHTDGSGQDLGYHRQR